MPSAQNGQPRIICAGGAKILGGDGATCARPAMAGRNLVVAVGVTPGATTFPTSSLAPRRWHCARMAACARRSMSKRSIRRGSDRVGAICRTAPRARAPCNDRSLLADLPRDAELPAHVRHGLSIQQADNEAMRSSITELAFHGIHTSRQKGEKCYPYVRYDVSPISRAAQSRQRSIGGPFRHWPARRRHMGAVAAAFAGTQFTACPVAARLQTHTTYP